ncbi:MAG: response regulator, partial [Candidatus Neomarinimicrobiota bacterium]
GNVSDFVHYGGDEETIKVIGQYPAGIGLDLKGKGRSRIINIPDVGDNRREHRVLRDHPELKSLLSTPVLSRGRVYGRLLLVNKRDGEYFNETDQQQTARFTNSLGLVLDNLRLITRIRRSEAELRTLYDHAPVGIYQVTRDGQFLNCNRHFLNSLGYDSIEELAGLNAVDLYLRPEARAQKLQDLEESGHLHSYEISLRDKTGEIHHFLDSITAIRNAEGKIEVLEGMLLEITEQKTAEQERRHLEKQLRAAHQMETIGTMAGGIAHEFNNLLMGIMSYAELGRINSTKDSEFREYFNNIVVQAQRGAELVKQILAFSRQTALDLQPTDMVELLNPTLTFLRTSIEENITFKLEVDPDITPVMADSNHLQLTITNLAMNSRDAMPRGGTLTFHLSRIQIDEETAAAINDAQPGDYVRLSIIDSGVGIPANMLDRVIDPFYSTKGTGKGSGLGLSQAYGVIRQHYGFLTIDSKIGQGTTVNLYLPVSDQPTVAPEPVIETEPDILKNAKLPKGSGTILLVDDSKVIRRAGSELLKMLGYEIVTAQDGVEALALFRERSEEFLIVLSDVTMPTMSGIELSHAINKINPDTIVVLFSGYSSDPVVPELIKQGIVHGYIKKPFDIAEMAFLLHSIILGKA